MMSYSMRCNDFLKGSHYMLWNPHDPLGIYYQVLVWILTVNIYINVTSKYLMGHINMKGLHCF